MPVDTAASLTDAIRRSRLLEPDQLTELDRLQTAFPTPRALAGELIRRGWLTPYQVNKLLQDRGRELLLGSYVLLERLGEGGMGEVFKARNWKLGQVVALKLIRKERIDNPDALRRFQREIRAAAQLDHPHIVRAYDADEVGGVYLLVMEYVQGTDLSKLVKQSGPLPVDKACDYARQAALGLQHACERGLVHRDIKPHNLLLTPQGVVKILDMGLARLDRRTDDGMSATMTREGTVMGTLDYISPEQAMDSHDVDIRADLYSLGCTLYFLLTGKVPFPGGEALQKLLKHRLDEPIPVEQLRRDVPPGVAAVVRKLMAKRPEDRYQTPAEAAAALAAVIAEPLSAEATIPAAGQVAPARELPDAADRTATEDTDAARRWADERRRQRKGEERRRIGLYAVGGVMSLGLAGLLVLLLLRFGLPAPKTVAPPASNGGPSQALVPEVLAVSFDQWLKDTAALSAEDQVKAVMRKLQDLNPGFDGKETHTVKDGAVTELAFYTDNVVDISPVPALTGLKKLYCGGSAWQKGRLRDLAPLKGMALSSLDFEFTAVIDLWPLRGLKLTHLTCTGTQVTDLAPLKGMPLTDLVCSAGPLSDLSPLKDLKLTGLTFDQTLVTDLAPLKGMPLTNLNCSNTGVSDLSPLKDMKLTWLACNGTRADLSPLKGVPLKVLYCDFNPNRDAEILRSIQTLVTIQGRPAADFLKAVEEKQAAFETWCKQVAAMKPDEQYKAVAEELKKRNPDFKGVVTPTIEDGVVTGLEFLTDNVTDVSPVRALTGLKSLRCDADGWGKGRIADLWPLKGMTLAHLNCNCNKVSDLAALRGMPLRELHCNGNQVSDLTPLAGLQLTILNCGGNPITDVSPLKGMPLATLFCNDTGVSNLAPLKGMPLTHLLCIRTPISDLTPLAGMKLTSLWCLGTKATDLSPLKGMPLREIGCDFNPWRDADILRSLKTLEAINGQPAADFWKKQDADRAAFEAWCKEVAAMKVDEQVEAVKAELKKRNTGFNGAAKPTIENGVVTELKFLTNDVTDLSPARALTGLKTLGCFGSDPGRGQLSDLSPLKGMKLAQLIVYYTQVSDLSPVKDIGLGNLNCEGTKVSNLSPLKDVKLTRLWCGNTQVSDLTPLKDMKLTYLRCTGSPVSDLSPLKDMPLKEIVCDFVPERDARILRSIKTLETINDQPAADFWKKQDADRAAFDAWCKQVAAMKPDEQIEAVKAELKKRNPGFNGEVTPTIESGVATGLEFLTDDVTDLAPVRALTELKSLRCAGSAPGKGRLSDLSPLKAMTLTYLDCRCTNVTDLAPLKAVKLTYLHCGCTPASDLSPLKGMPLTELYCHQTQVSSLTPLEGMKLTGLHCANTQVSDLAPLKDMKLTWLICQGTKVTDLSPLKDMPLEKLRCDFVPERDARILRSIKTLETINDQPAANFWKALGDTPPKP